MFMRSLLRAVPVVMTFAVMGCGGASSPDTEPTAPPVTAESLDDMTKDINSQQGGMTSPGVSVPNQ